MNDVKRLLQPIYAPWFDRSPTARMVVLLAKSQVRRDTEFVHDGYMGSWGAYQRRLDRCQTLDEWLCIPGFDDVAKTHVFEGKVRRDSFDSNAYWNDEIALTIRQHFPEARSVTEYGCGVGRNLLQLKRRFPEMACFGYELAEAGVEVARRAAEKFAVDVQYAQLDYIKDGPEKYVHPETDIALTVFSLEQIPHANPVAVKNMLDHARLGTIHVEPVCENYPWSYWGVLGRLYSKRVDFLQNFDAAVRALPVRAVHSRTLASSHNPLVPTPSVYVLVK